MYMKQWSGYLVQRGVFNVDLWQMRKAEIVFSIEKK